MSDTEAPRDEQQARPAGKEKKLYHKPTFRYERVFETLALSCGKISGTGPQCVHVRKNS